MRQQHKLWDSQRERKNFPTKISNLRHSWACSQNKGLSEYQRRASQLRTGPSPCQRQVGDSQNRKARGNLGPRDDILHQTVSGLPVANQVFLGSWMLDICQEGCSQRSAEQRRHMAHLRRNSLCAPRKPRDWDQGGDKMHRPSGNVHSPSTWSPELFGPGKGKKLRPNQVCAFVEYPRR